MLHALRTFFGRRDPAQLSLELDTVELRTADDLLARLASLGLRRITSCRLTRNANVMVSFRAHELRVHEGYLSAPADIHEAIVAFVEGRTRAERRAASRRIVAYAGVVSRPTARQERMHPDDEPLAAKLAEWHARYNAEHFGGSLATVPIRVSRRMKSRLGHYTGGSGDRGIGGPADRDGDGARVRENGKRLGEIAISWRHVRRHGWGEVLHTLLHEMVHQWQDENGLPIDHGPRFRAKAREVGIDAAAKRAVARRSS